MAMSIWLDKCINFHFIMKDEVICTTTSSEHNFKNLDKKMREKHFKNVKDDSEWRIA